MRFPWATSDGRNGSVELIRLPNKSDSWKLSGILKTGSSF